MVWSVVAWLMACSDGGATPSADTDSAAGLDTPAESDTPAIDAWTWSVHPCAGERTDTLLMVPAGPWFVGCGTTVPGTGLYQSEDAGATWAPFDALPTGYFDDFRVNDLFLGPDGLLYISGANTDNGQRAADAVVAVDPQVARDGAVEVLTIFENGRQTWNSFLVGTFRRTTSGFAIAESLTGTDLTWRTSDAQEWADGYGWWPDGEARQILDLEQYADAIYGCGSTIAQPPSVYLPPRAPLDGSLTFEVLTLDDHDGELWDMVVDAHGVVAVGVDEDDDVGQIFVSGADPYDAAGWTRLRLDAWFPDAATSADGVCRQGDDIVVVGRFSVRAEGLAVLSRDGGATWEDITPAGAPSLSTCQIDLQGHVVVAGAGGALGTYTFP
jgi:hypothetical protein